MPAMISPILRYDIKSLLIFHHSLLPFTILGASNSQSMPDRGNGTQSQRGMNGLEYDSGTMKKSSQVLEYLFELCKFEIILNY